MAISKQDMIKLVLLQEQDKLLDSLQAAIDLIPQDIAALRGEVEAEKQRVNASKEKATQLQLKKKGKEMELAQKEEAARKHSQDLNQVKTNEAFKALQTEIDRAKAQAGELETEILMIMEEVDAASREEKALLAEIKKVEAVAEEQVRVLEARKAEQETRLSGEQAKRETLTGDVPAELLTLYNETRKRRKGLAMARMRGNMCDVCHITLPPQVIVNILKGTRVITCESCQRILYSTDSVAASAAAQSGSAKPA